MEEKQVVRSFHTFAFPFIWEQGGTKLEDLANSFREEGNPYWACDNMENEYTLSEERALDWEERKLFYAEYQYFYPAVRTTLYGTGNPVTAYRFTFLPDKSKQNVSYNHNAKMKYIITITDQNGKKKFYHLALNGIRLRLYNTGVGILQLECENHSYTKLADIKAINEYGRRVGVASVPTFANADEIGVHIDGLEVQLPLTSFRSFLKKEGEAERKQAKLIGSKDLPLTYFAPFLTNILNLGNRKYQFASSKTEEKNTEKKKKEIVIYPAIDDRMFTHCMVQLDGSCADRVFDYFSNPEESSEDIEKSVYELIYIDTEGSCSCQERKMRRREIEESAYLRWLDWRSVYAVTHHSMVMISQGTPDFLINSFLTEYLELSCLCLAQKASLISLQAKMTRISSGLEIDGKRMKNDKISALADLQERFVAFSNQLDFYGVTEQYQGVELYNMLRKQLYINEARENLHQQIEALYETANVNQDYTFNKWAFGFALMALFWAFFSAWSDGIAALEPCPFDNIKWIMLGIIIILAVLALGAMAFFFRRKK